MQYIVLLIFGIIGISIFVVKRKSNSAPADIIQAKGIVTEVIYNDTGDICYCINIDNGNGQVIKSQSICYSKTNPKYNVEDMVSVGYYTRNNKTCCRINDSELIPVNDISTTLSKVALFFGIAFITLFLMFLIKGFVL